MLAIYDRCILHIAHQHSGFWREKSSTLTAKLHPTSSTFCFIWAIEYHYWATGQPNRSKWRVRSLTIVLCIHIVLMGRVRRNQRDAIRKKRAKRRNKQTGGNDSDGDDSIEQIAAKRRRVAEDTIPAVSNKHSNSQLVNKEADRSSSTLPPQEESVSEASVREDTSGVQQCESTLTEKTPVDRIERMRLKKQQQKARRKEKKAARAAAAGESLKKAK